MAEMMFLPAAAALVAVGALAGLARAEPGEALLQDGAYEVQVRVELPNVQNWAATTTTTICLPHAGGASDAPIPVLSTNNPIAKCPARNVQRNDATLTFDIVCDGRGAARARAVYTLTPHGFRGRIAMVMGGKNMTMTEVQVGRRVGACDPPRTPRR